MKTARNSRFFLIILLKYIKLSQNFEKKSMESQWKFTILVLKHYTYSVNIYILKDGDYSTYFRLFSLASISLLSSSKSSRVALFLIKLLAVLLALKYLLCSLFFSIHFLSASRLYIAFLFSVPFAHY